MHNEFDEQLIDGVLGFDLDTHGDEEGHEEEHAARERYDLLRRQVHLVARKFGDLPLVGQEAHDRRDRAANHNDQIDDEDEMQNLVLAGNSGETPVAELQIEK